MTRHLFSIAALAATLSAPALAAPTGKTIHFERDGIEYVAQVRDTGTAQLISGHEVRTGRTFDLRVANGRVSGNYAGTSVTYTAGTSEVTMPLQTAAR